MIRTSTRALVLMVAIVAAGIAWAAGGTGESSATVEPSQAAAAAPTFQLPAKAVPQDTLAVIHIDMTALKPAALEQTLAAIYDAIPKSDAAAKFRLMASSKRDEAATHLKAFHKAFGDIEGSAIAITLAPREPLFLFKARPDSGKEIQAALAVLGAKPLAVVHIGDGWHTFRYVALEGEGDAASAQFFAASLSTAGDGPVRLAFRMDDNLKTFISKGLASGIEGMPPEPWPVEKFKYLTATLRLGNKPQLNFTTYFADAGSAQAYLDWTAKTLDHSRDLVKRQLADIPADVPLPDPETVDAIFEALREQREGSTTVLQITMTEIGHVMKFAPMMKPVLAALRGEPSPRR